MPSTAAPGTAVNVAGSSAHSNVAPAAGSASNRNCALVESTWSGGPETIVVSGAASDVQLVARRGRVDVLEHVDGADQHGVVAAGELLGLEVVERLVAALERRRRRASTRTRARTSGAVVRAA